jgi:hypothetical protein
MLQPELIATAEAPKDLPAVTRSASDVGPTQAPRPCWRALAAVVLFTLCLQVISATFVLTSFGTANSGASIANSLAQRGIYACAWWPRLKGDRVRPEDGELRMFHLPGEPLYLAFGFRFLPAWAHRYMHVPVTVLFVAAVAAVAGYLGGRSLCLLTGLVAAAQPFVIVHGPGWEDTFLEAALVWTLVALLGARLRRPGERLPSAPLWAWGRWLLIAALAGYASITRSLSLPLLALLAVAVCLLPRLRPARRDGAAMVAGIGIALGLWGLRNYLVCGELVLGDTHVGIGVCEANCAHSRPLILEIGGCEGMNDVTMTDHWPRTEPLTEAEANRYFLKVGLDYIRSHPLDVLQTGLLRTALGVTTLRPWEPLTTAKNLHALTWNSLLLLLAGFGAASARLRGASAAALLVTVFFVLVTGGVWTMIFFGTFFQRYRIIFDGFLWIGAAATLLHVFRRVKGAARGGSAAPAVSGALALPPAG